MGTSASSLGVEASEGEEVTTVHCQGSQSPVGASAESPTPSTAERGTHGRLMTPALRPQLNCRCPEQGLSSSGAKGRCRRRILFLVQLKAPCEDKSYLFGDQITTN